MGAGVTNLLNLGHKLINLVFMGIPGHSTSIRKKFVGIRSILLKNWEGIFVFYWRRYSCIFLTFSKCANTFLNTFEYFGIYFGILWNAVG